MGANEKHAATSHGREYTPDTTRVRHAYVDYSAQLQCLPSNDKVAGEAFDRWLETVRAEAKAEAWDEGYGEKIACPRTCGDCAHCREDDTYNPYK